MKPHILFVDDEPNVLDGLRRTMRRVRGEWDLSFSLGGREALSLLEKNHVDVVVSDMRMPDIDGVQLLREVRDQYPDVVRMVLSGQCNIDAVYSVVGSCHQFLSKPCVADDLENTIRRALALRSKITNEKFKKQVADLEGLPAPSPVYQKLVSLLNSEEASVTEISDLISQDVAMCAKVMQLGNSGYFGAPHKISTPSQAVNLLGLETIGVLVLTSGVLSELTSSNLSKDAYQEITLRSQRCATLAQEIARAENLDSRSTGAALVAGMLQDVGILVLAGSEIEGYQQMYSYACGHSGKLNELEKTAFGDGHATIGAYLLALWGFPSAIIDAVAFHHEPGTSHSRDVDVLTVVYAADALLSSSSVDGDMPPAAEIFDAEYLEQIDAADKGKEWINLYLASAAQPTSL